MNIREAAESLNVSHDTIRRRIRTGQIRAEKLEGVYGLQWVIDEESLADNKHIIEIVPVKRAIDSNQLMDNIRFTIQDAIQEAIKESTEAQTEEIKELRQEIEALTNAIKEQNAIKDNKGNKFRRWLNK